MHWFDEDTVEVVEALLREELGRLLVVITARQLPSLPGKTQLFEVKPLSDAESDTLIRTLHPQIRPDARRAVQQRCDGIPLYIEEVVAKLKELPSNAGESAQVPDSLYETLFARLRSSTNVLLVVEAAALIGSLVDGRLLSSVVELDPRAVDDVLQELTRGRVLEPVLTDSWRFHHELLREVAAELSPPSLRRRLHSRIADVLGGEAADAAPDWPLMAHHYEQAERFHEAASACQKASGNARQRGALGEARTHLARALENIEKLAPSPSRDRHEVAIRLERGFLASAATGHASTTAAAEFERCLQLIGEEPSLELYATFSALWSYYATRGDLRRATQLVEALRMRLEDMPEWYRAANDAVFGSLAVFRGEFHTARPTLEAAAAAYPDLDLSRVGIRGWSHGGYLAALAVLRRPDVFHAAVAGAPVTDMRLYDTFYNERYLGLPDEHPEAYEHNSIIADAPKLERPLMLIHGLADDNVVVAHSLRMSSALLAAGRPHTVLPLSGITHMASQEEVAENLLLLQVDFLHRALSG